nr:AraC family transcriptional regulator [Pseudomonas sp. RIT-PI-S]
MSYTNAQPGAGPYVTPIADVLILRSDQKKPPVHRVSAPAICIVAQGAKWAMFGDSRFDYRAGEALIVGVEAPSLGRVLQASPDEPCLVLAIALDLTLLRDVAETLDTFGGPDDSSAGGFFVADFQGPLSECALRIVRLLDTPQAISTIYPLIMQEMYFWLLTGPHGRQIARMALANQPSGRIKNAVDSLRARFSQPVRLDELAAAAQLSPSAFHRQFKALTSLTPLQYQKQLRLLEARRLMTSQGVNVETAAFQVGYESQSQFSREYSRMFGEPPKRHLRALAGLSA